VQGQGYRQSPGRLGQQEQWQELLVLIRERRNYLITTHVNPDGDAIGSEIALALVLKDLGKGVRILNDSPTPNYLQFLDLQNLITSMVQDAVGELKEELTEVEAIFILDISDIDRLGRVKHLIMDHPAPKVCLDHHPPHDLGTEIKIVDEGACNTGLLVFELINRLGVPLTRAMAEALYVALLTDTGSFRFSNTDEKAFEMAAQLVKAGAVGHELYSRIYEQGSWSRMRLLGKALSSIESCCDNKVAYFIITQDLLRSYGVEPEELEGFVEYPRMIDGVEVVILFLEMEEKVRVSLRSKGNVNVQELASSLGGGGHPYAAGVRIKKPLSQAVTTVLTAVEKSLAR